jgi:uncharacterized protein YndB with AHSA1/START domain
MENVKQKVKAEIVVDAPIENVWEYWTIPEHIKHWNNLTADWHTPVAKNDLQPGGKLFLRMEKKDGSDGFNHECIYDEIELHKKISYTTDDNRKTVNEFAATGKGVTLTETFEIPFGADPESHRSFCQGILNNFKSYVEGL